MDKLQLNENFQQDNSQQEVKKSWVCPTMELILKDEIAASTGVGKDGGFGGSTRS